MSGIYSEEVIKPYKEYMIRLGILADGEEKVFQDIAYTLRNVSKGQLQTVFNQASGMGMIRIISSWKGKVKASREPIDIDEAIAMEINYIEAELLKKHEISKSYSLMFKNSPKTKAFKADWLDYIENVEDAEGDAMRLQYIYEVFQIEVLNKNALDEFIKAHYPFEIDSFKLQENEQAYHSKLLDYVLGNAQKEHDNYLMKKQGKKVQNKEAMKEIMIGLGLTEEEATAFVREQEEEEVDLNQKEPSPYVSLLESDKYVDCIRNIHIQLHSMNEIDIKEIKAVQKMIDEDRRKEFEQLGLDNPEQIESNKSEKNGIHNYDESSVNIEQHEELTKKEQIKQNQANQTNKENGVENLKQKGITTIAKSNIEPTNHNNEILDDEYMAAIEDIRDEIREYEEKYGDKAMEYLRLDSVIMELAREVKAEESIAEYKQKLQREKEAESRKWDKLFEGGQTVKWRQTTNNPLEVFQRIRNGGK
ncbi:hypothetical protein [Bacillus sp. CECT 9360]|uniref:hypothetical protein n=1 Tax=Bacillus sp. CECT 9360 TaxID=2845821 RepID=UPI001E4B7779|nr:hypothetical protein [Bacillus sp. CECT 9360]CAH0344642.1 hypothetical protein BCI9360_00902 [Bacillus sp. CECT 9360]